MNRNNDNVRDGNSIQNNFLDSLPIVTKYWFISTVGVTLAVNFGVVSGSYFTWSSMPLLLSNPFQHWYRLVTAFLYGGGFSFHLLITLLCLYQHSKAYESRSVYNTGGGGGTSDYITMLVFGMVTMLSSTYLIELSPLFCQNLVYYVLYVFSKRHPTDQTALWGIPVQNAMLPFAILGLNVLMGNYWQDMAHGMAVGHLYYFLVDVYPQIYGKDVLHTPQFLINYMGTGEYTYVPPTPAQTTTTFGQTRTLGATGSGTPAPATGHNWGGGGQALGSN